MIYTIYTDGSCLKNPGGPGGYAAVIFRDGEMIEELSGGDAVTTSNRMEIMAVIVGLRAVREPSVITLYSDSQYLIKTLTLGWKRLKTWTSGPGWTKPRSRTAFRGNGSAGTMVIPGTSEPTRWRIKLLACTGRMRDSSSLHGLPRPFPAILHSYYPELPDTAGGEPTPDCIQAATIRLCSPPVCREPSLLVA
jgi:hypothetical protein